MDTELLLEAAKKLAAGQALGLSPDQTLAMLRRGIKRGQRENPSVTEEALLKQMFEATAAANEVAPAELSMRKDIPTARNEFTADDLQTLSRGDRDYDKAQAAKRTAQRVEEEYEEQQNRLARRVDGNRDKRGNRVFENPLGQWEPSAQEVVRDREGVIDSTGVREALARLKAANAAAGGLEGAAAIEGSLEDSLGSSQTVGAANNPRNADASLGRELVRRDNQNYNPVSPAAKWNNARAAQEARVLGAAMGEIITDTDAAAKARYRGEGYKGQNVLNAIVSQQQRELSIPAAGRAADIETREGLYVDPITGSPLAMDEPATTAIAGANTPDTAQMVNAPKASSSISWVAKSVPQPNTFANSGGDMPQVDIGQATQLFSERLRSLKGVGPGLQNISSNVRSVDEFQKAVDYVIDQGNRRGMQWKKEVTGDSAPGSERIRRFEPTTKPGVDEVMRLLRYTPAEKEALAGALYQLELAKGASVDDKVKQAYFARQANPRNVSDIAFGSKEALAIPNVGEAQSQVALIKPSARHERKGLLTQLNKLRDSDARSAEIGLIEGEPSRIYRVAPPGVAPADIPAYYAAEEEGWAKKSRKPVNVERGRQKGIRGQLAAEKARRADVDRAQDATIEAALMQEAQQDFQNMVRAERETVGREGERIMQSRARARRIY